MIDLFLTNNKCVFTDVKAIPSLSMDADHRLVVAKVRINKPKENKGKGARRYKVDKLKEQAIVEELQQIIQTNL